MLINPSSLLPIGLLAPFAHIYPSPKKFSISCFPIGPVSLHIHPGIPNWLSPFVPPVYCSCALRLLDPDEHLHPLLLNI